MEKGSRLSTTGGIGNVWLQPLDGAASRPLTTFPGGRSIPSTGQGMDGWLIPEDCHQRRCFGARRPPLTRNLVVGGHQNYSRNIKLPRILRHRPGSYAKIPD